MMTRTPSAVPQTTAVYDTLWRMAAERQRIYRRRLRNEAQPWTGDPVLRSYRFTNAYRAADRVSQYAIKLGNPTTETPEPADVFLRMMLLKLFNLPATYETLTNALGTPYAASFDFEAAARVLNERRQRRPIYNNAYVMPPGGDNRPKHLHHLDMIRRWLTDGLPEAIADRRQHRGLRDIYQTLRKTPRIGPFLGFQLTIDLNYTPLIDHAEENFVVAGPGALDGLSKCFSSTLGWSPEQIIFWMTEHQERELADRTYGFDDLWGRPLQPVDIQNTLCEVSKHSRQSHPEVDGVAKRRRIKQRFSPAGPLSKPFFPPRWGINTAIDEWWNTHGPRGAVQPGPDGQRKLPLDDND